MSTRIKIYEHVFTKLDETLKLWSFEHYLSPKHAECYHFAKGLMFSLISLSKDLDLGKKSLADLDSLILRYKLLVLDHYTEPFIGLRKHYSKRSFEEVGLEM